jgi:hypothetical protein
LFIRWDGGVMLAVMTAEECMALHEDRRQLQLIESGRA